MHYIYKIINLINNKVYIGQTVNPRNRWYKHKASAAKPTQVLHKAIKKYGNENFKFEIIDFAFNKSQVDCLEINYIKMYNSYIKEFGYNISKGGQPQSSEKTRFKKGQVPWSKGKKFPWLSERNRLMNKPRFFGCKIPGCDGIYDSKGYCKKHYGQSRNKGIRGPNREFCTIEGCGGKHEAKGYCRKHYRTICKKS